jgi:hypothetical protein
LRTRNSLITPGLYFLVELNKPNFVTQGSTSFNVISVGDDFRSKHVKEIVERANLGKCMVEQSSDQLRSEVFEELCWVHREEEMYGPSNNRAVWIINRGRGWFLSLAASITTKQARHNSLLDPLSQFILVSYK